MLPKTVSADAVGVVPGPRQATHDLLPVVPATPRAGAKTRRIPRRAAAVDAGLAAALALIAVYAVALEPIVAACSALAWPLALWAAGHYRAQPLGERSTARAQRVTTTGLKAGLVALATLPWLAQSTSPTSLALLVAAFSAASGVPALLTGVSTRQRMVLAGDPDSVRATMAEVLAAGTHDVVAVCLTTASAMPFGDLAVYHGMEQAVAAAHDHDADALVVLPGPHLSPATVRRLHWAAAAVDTHLFVGTGMTDVAPTRTRVLATAGIDVLHVAPPSLGGPRRVAKEVVERTLALAAVLVLLPLLVVIAVLVRLDSPGSALFRQERVGRHGNPFTMLKFRSMSVSAESDRTGLVACNDADGVLFKILQDPRVTRIGAWLRRYSLDELPQLWNVVRGDMSLVGPRPALPDEVARYEHDPRRRLVVKPGLTGLWQVSGRSDLSWAESVRLDLRYVENWSLRLDAMILVRTVRAVVSHRGAY